MPFEVKIVPGTHINRSSKIVAEEIAAVYESADARLGKIIGAHVLQLAEGRGSQLYLVAQFPEPGRTQI